MSSNKILVRRNLNHGTTLLYMPKDTKSMAALVVQLYNASNQKCTITLLKYKPYRVDKRSTAVPVFLKRFKKLKLWNKLLLDSFQILETPVFTLSRNEALSIKVYGTNITCVVSGIVTDLE